MYCTTESWERSVWLNDTHVCIRPWNIPTEKYGTDISDCCKQSGFLIPGYYRKTDIYINNTCNLVQYLCMHINDSRVIIEFNEHYLSFQEIYEWITTSQPQEWQVLKVMIVICALQITFLPGMC